MSEHHATIAWQRTSPDFKYMTYNRAHEWRFTAVTVAASAAQEYRGEPERVNPEEAFVAALSSCHMLTLLAVAAKQRLVLDSYDDDAVGVLEKNAEGHMAITRVTLRPRIAWAAGVTVSDEQLGKLHHDAHVSCFIANSVTTVVTVEPQT